MKRILITDDNERNRYLLKVLLEANGFEVITAVNGAHALDLARERRPDIIVTDILMPVMDGFVLCRHWKADPDLKPVPFIFYTATYTDSKDQEFALSLGADGFLIKPQEPDVFLRMLHRLVTERDANQPTQRPRADLDEQVFLQEYNYTLVRQLEQKLVELEETKRALEQDVEDRHQTEQTLRDSEERKRQIIEHAPDAIVTINAAGQIIDWNRQAEQLFGWAREEAHWRQMSELIIPPRFRQAHETGLRRALANNVPQPLPQRLKIVTQNKAGTEFPAEMSIASFLSGESQILCAYFTELRPTRS